jgi:hypothetical protein
VPIEFEFLSSALTPLAQDLAVPEPPKPAEPTPVTQRERTKTARGRPVEASIASVESSESPARSDEAAAGSVAPAPLEVPVEPAHSEPAPSRGRPMDLSPLAAALTMRESLLAANSCGAALAGGSRACGDGRRDAGVAGGQGELGAGPRSLIALRKEAHLKPQADGSYGFDGPSFHATVAPDGRVTFDDKIHDLNSFVERTVVGMQINTAEKRRFMESTAALRDQLADAAEAQNQRRAAVTLQSTLRAVLANAKLSLAQKRSTLFSLWDDCASDASGSAAQGAIESFVRAHMPEDSPLAYSAAELSQLNRRRVSRRMFDPYAGGDAGAQPG